MKTSHPTSSGAARVREHLLDGILRGTWSAGDRLPSERSLVDTFGVSRASVRELLSELGGLGVIDRTQRRGAVVRSVVGTDALARLFPFILAHDGVRTHRHVFEVRLALETHAVGLAATRCSQEEADRIEAAARAYGDAVERDERTSDLDFEFHKQIAEATHNPLFPSLLAAISGFVIYAQRESAGGDLERKRAVHEEHMAIARAIRRHDADRARSDMMSHLHRSADRIRAETG